MVKEVPNIIFRLLDLGLERIISEVIDNSLDKNADDIRVNFVIPNSEAKNAMTVIRDNGDGFDSLEFVNAIFLSSIKFCKSLKFISI